MAATYKWSGTRHGNVTVVKPDVFIDGADNSGKVCALRLEEARQQTASVMEAKGFQWEGNGWEYPNDILPDELRGIISQF